VSRARSATQPIQTSRRSSSPKTGFSFHCYWRPNFAIPAEVAGSFVEAGKLGPILRRQGKQSPIRMRRLEFRLPGRIGLSPQLPSRTHPPVHNLRSNQPVSFEGCGFRSRSLPQANTRQCGLVFLVVNSGSFRTKADAEAQVSRVRDAGYGDAYTREVVPP
jgi:hypothetical protein